MTNDITKKLSWVVRYKNREDGSNFVIARFLTQPDAHDFIDVCATNYELETLHDPEGYIK